MTASQQSRKKNIVALGNFEGQDIQNARPEVRLNSRAVEIATCGVFPTPVEAPLLTPSPSSTTNCEEGSSSTPTTPSPSSMYGKGQSKGGGKSGAIPPTTPPSTTSKAKGDQGKATNNASTLAPSGQSKGKGARRTLTNEARSNAELLKQREVQKAPRRLQTACSDDFYSVDATIFDTAMTTPSLTLAERVDESTELFCAEYPATIVPGSVSKAELRNLVSPVRSIDEPLFDAIFSQFDMNGDGSINYFEALMFCEGRDDM